MRKIDLHYQAYQENSHFRKIYRAAQKLQKKWKLHSKTRLKDSLV